MSRRWSILFLLLPLVGAGVFGVAPFLGWSLPVNVSPTGREIDLVYGVILFLTGTVFLGTQIFLFYVLYRFGDRPGSKAAYIHGNAKAEWTWTLIPAAIFTGILMLQWPAWRTMQESPPPGTKLHARITARRFEWQVRHAGPDGVLDTPDDVVVNNELHVPADRDVWIELQTNDVIHSMFIPQMRFKQDAVPGMKIPIRLRAESALVKATVEASASFRAVDLISPTKFVARVRNQASDVDKILWEGFSESTRKAIESHDPAKRPTMELEAALVADLNRIIDSRCVDRPGKCDRAENRAILARHYEGVVAPNRGWLEFVCAELCGDGHFQMHGRLFVHPDASDCDAWVKQALAKQEASK